MVWANESDKVMMAASVTILESLPLVLVGFQDKAAKRISLNDDKK